MNRGNTRWLVWGMVFGLLTAAGCGKPATSGSSGESAKTADSAASKASSASPVAAATPLAATTAHEVLEKMAAAYRAAPSYEDFGTLEFRSDPTQERSETRASFSVTLQRPNKLRIEFFNGKVICNGQQWCAFCDSVPGQAVLREAPAKVSMNILRADSLLSFALTDGEQLTSPQLQLLLDDDPINSLVNGSQEVVLDEPGRLGDYNCYRVRVALPQGSEYLWIDQRTFALRMMVVPITTAARPADGDARSNPVWLVINFERARLGGDIDPKAFQFDVAPDVKKVRVLVQTGPNELVGQKLPEFKFIDLQGKSWSSQSLAGKTAVIHFWRTDAKEGDRMIPAIEQLQAKYRGNDKVALLAVSLDHPDTTSKTIEDAGRELKLTVPLLRDKGMEARERLKIIELPTTLFVNAKGVLQNCDTGFSPLAAAAAARKLEMLLAGQDLVKQTLDEYQQRTKTIERYVDIQFSAEAHTSTIEQPKPLPPAAKSQPKKFRLTSLWKSTAVGAPGNILVFNSSSGVNPRIAVIDGYKTIAELAPDGKRLAAHTVKLADEEIFTLLRTAAGSDGKRYFIAFAPWQQRCHLFDADFKYLLSYPDDALANRNTGITDVELADLDGNGKLKIYAAFGGTVGVKCVSLQAEKISSCRTLFNVTRVLPGPPGGKGVRDLYCISDANSLDLLDAKLSLQGATQLSGDGIVLYLQHAGMAGSGFEAWCGLLMTPENNRQLTTGRFTAFGLSAKGEMTWKYELPFGTQQLVEPIVVGHLLPGNSRQWLLPGCDGSIHILASDGTPIDRFNYGEQITGLATLEIDGKLVLLVSSASGVEALRVE